MNIEESISKKIFCVFTTKLGESYEVPKTPLNIDSSSSNEELNDILQQILKLNKKQTNVKFDFIFAGEILKGDLKSYLLKHNKTSEKNIELEYIIALGEPKLEKSQNLENWLNTVFIQTDKEKNDSPVFISCLFNSSIDFLNENLELETKLNILEKEDELCQNILSYGLFEDTDYNYIFSSNYVGELYVSKINKDDRSFATKFLENCNSSYSSILVNPLTSNFFTGDNEGNLVRWAFDTNSLSVKNLNENKIHQTTIQNMLYLNEFEIMTSSIDDSLKIVDVNRLKPSFDLYFKDSTVSSFDYNNEKRLILTGHVKGGIKSFDERIRNKVAKDVFLSHKSFVSQIKVVRNTENFISSCYNGIIKVWDYRMDLPIYSINCHEGKKVFVLESLDENIFISGGEDNKIVKHSLK